MYPLAHLGIGAALARSIAKNSLPLRWLLVGTLLPDLIDKPLFFAMGLPGKRGFAHTLLFLLFLCALARLLKRRSKLLYALALGAATHQILDIVSKAFAPDGLSGALAVLLWPAFGMSFPTLPAGFHGTLAITLELLGAVLLIRLRRIPS